MRPHLFTILSAMSLVLCVATLALWVRSSRVGISIEYWGREAVYEVHLASGLVAFEISDNIVGHPKNGLSTFSPLSPEGRWLMSDMQAHYGYRNIRHLGPIAYSEQWQGTIGVHIILVTIRLWVIALFSLLGSGPLLLHRRVAARGHCRSCGYDLRATPDRCPECGCITEHQLAQRIG